MCRAGKTNGSHGDVNFFLLFTSMLSLLHFPAALVDCIADLGMH